MAPHEERPIAREPWQRLLQEDGDGPPDTTDARIRAAARRALRPRVSRWLLPVSLAASVVLAVVIVERQYGDRGAGELMTEKDVAAPAVADLPPPPAPTDSPRRRAERPAEEERKNSTVAGSRLPATKRARQESSEARDDEARAESPPASFSSEVPAPADAEIASQAPREASPGASLWRAKEQTRSPEDWYAEIEKLRAAGRTEEADRELERLEAAYPGWLERHLEEMRKR
jgi:hypothetical protein